MKVASNRHVGKSSSGAFDVLRLSETVVTVSHILLAAECLCVEVFVYVIGDMYICIHTNIKISTVHNRTCV